MFRVSSPVGWDEYRIQKRRFGFLWLNYGSKIYTGYEAVTHAVIRLNAK